MEKLAYRIKSRTNSTGGGGGGNGGKGEIRNGVSCDKRIRFRPNGKLQGGAVSGRWTLTNGCKEKVRPETEPSRHVDRETCVRERCKFSISKCIHDGAESTDARVVRVKRKSQRRARATVNLKVPD